MRFRNLILGLSLCAILLGLVSCGGAGGGSNGSRLPGIYVIDEGNDRIVWMNDMAGTIFNSFGVANTGVTDVVNGTIGPDGKLYLIDGNNDSIVRFDSLAGTGRLERGSNGTGVGEFLNPVRIHADGSARVLVVDRDRNALIRWNLGSGWEELDLSTWFSSGDEPDVTTDIFGHIFVAGGSQIVRLNGMTANGAVTFGTSGSGVGQFGDIKGIAIDDTQRIYIADGGNHRIARINDMLGNGWLAFGALGSGVNQFNIPFGIGVDHQNFIYVSDRNNHRIVRIASMTGTGWTEFSGGVGIGTFSFPLSIYPHLNTF